MSDMLNVFQRMAPVDEIDRRFPKAGEINSGDLSNVKSHRARLRYWGAEESTNNPARTVTQIAGVD